ncbi:nitrogenase iron-molybdenum cofactor biosynthesis protein NifE [Anaeroarcus burkinensis]|uniref:nitrogenase iron-molybdenum cofactor biosynthesis protein NifE n=1 Tax=Anaeroarcus burkinensis TaxID=82376 RepID=UPI000401FB22|nr:nitrogenase iron-molybdenum cofactor biosynthesis protein NifE [Anaeroarcus burkinensis]
MEEARSLAARDAFIVTKGQKKTLQCDADSIAGCVSQRACVYCGARVVLNPITDALHLVHGPIGCASYTWDIRGSLSSGEDLFRNSFSTDMQEEDIIFGGEKKLALCLDELITKYRPPLAFVYSTCIVGVIGDDLKAVCKAAAERHGIEVLPVESSGFIGNKAAGYRAACDALLRLIAVEPAEAARRRKERRAKSGKPVINYLGDFNLAGEAWIIRDYLRRLGVELNVVFTGDATYADLKRAPEAELNIIQCAGSMQYLAGNMQDVYGIPSLQVSFLGMDDTASSLRAIAQELGEAQIAANAEAVIAVEAAAYAPQVGAYRQHLEGKKAAVYVGGGFKAVSLIRQFREVGMEVVMVGSQTGRKEEYALMNDLVQEGAVILDDANPAELERFLLEQGADLLVGGVKERPLAYKLGRAFLDHNHDRKHPLSGYVGALNFAKEVYSSICSPVWRHLGEAPWLKKGGV